MIDSKYGAKTSKLLEHTINHIYNHNANGLSLKKIFSLSFWDNRLFDTHDGDEKESVISIQRRRRGHVIQSHGTKLLDAACSRLNQSTHPPHLDALFILKGSHKGLFYCCQISTIYTACNDLLCLVLFVC
ncbi:hypothetical protein P8452_07937 [Trifolium repens]|nr:hypothetical protein P8452_07937 [Trifolium repens]